jgi:hypothetical protein
MRTICWYALHILASGRLASCRAAEHKQADRQAGRKEVRYDRLRQRMQGVLASGRLASCRAAEQGAQQYNRCVSRACAIWVCDAHLEARQFTVLQGTEGNRQQQTDRQEVRGYVCQQAGCIICICWQTAESRLVPCRTAGKRTSRQ